MKRQMPNMGNMMKKMQQMQRQMLQAQQEIEEKEFEASVGGGAVVAKVNGKNSLVSLEISEDLMSADDREDLQDLIIMAVNEANRQATEAMANAMGQFTQGLSIPGL